MIPAFAVVGHPNKGKSSIVATLAEDDDIAVAPTPGTTRRANEHVFSIDGQPLYALVDTPGFQRAGAVLAWLESRDNGAQHRPKLVEEFVRSHRDEPRFHDECELLSPVVDGAGILYVVDGAKPYGAEYEIEMQILRWTGRPRMALINVIGAGDYVDEWRQALGQYFSLVRVFDAVHADFAKRVALLRSFAEIEESWRPALERAASALEDERRHRRLRSAAEVAQCLIDVMTMTERERFAQDKATDALHERLTKRLQAQIAEREQAARQLVQSIYLHAGLAFEEEAISSLLQADIFTAEGWELFGLSQKQLLVSGALSGAIAGGGVDALFGGATLLLGAGIGSVLGGLGAWLGGSRLAKVTVLTQPLGGKVLQVGPVTAPNFPWVVLGRAWIHHHVVSERNHARREAMSLVLAQDRHLMDAIPEDIRRELSRGIKEVGTSAYTEDLRKNLIAQLSRLFELTPPGAPE